MYEIILHRIKDSDVLQSSSKLIPIFSMKSRMLFKLDSSEIS